MGRQTKNIFGRLTVVLLSLALLFVFVCRMNQWDSLVFITMIPMWAWTAVGMVTTLLAWLIFRSKSLIVLFAIGLVVGLTFSEEPRSLARELFAPLKKKHSPANADSLRIVVINCGKNATQAVQDAAFLEPDLVFLQNSPPRREIEELAVQIFSDDQVGVLVGESAAIIGKGEFVATSLEKYAVHGRFRTPEGHVLDLTNVAYDNFFGGYRFWEEST
ncbi:MAG: hypothetical protein AAF226_11105, partial [Verrucomicrobiota bacterium]